MKKILLMTIMSAIVLTMAGCDNSSSSSSNSETSATTEVVESETEAETVAETDVVSDTEEDSNNDNDVAVDEVSEDETEEETTEANADDSETSDGDKFLGLWGCGRASITVENSDDGYEASIIWGDSAWQSVEWEYPLEYDADTDSMMCTGKGVKKLITYNDDGSCSEDVEYENGSATFTIENGKMIWCDHIEDSAEDMQFEYDGEAQ